VASIVIFFAALMSLGYRAVETVDSSVDRWPIGLSGLSVLGGYVFADFLSGVAHWAGDTVGDESTPFLGPHFVRPFRQHHVDPKAITHHDFIETNGNNCIVSAPLVAGMVLVMPGSTGLVFYLCVLVGSAAMFVFATNQIHKWAHADVVPGPVQWLQRARIILSPTHHAIHHAAPHDRYYCITTGWVNPLLGRLRFFRACEAVLGYLRPGLLHLEGRRRPSA
jgi:ubiquitin-conjugating enzyme E2 variant